MADRQFRYVAMDRAGRRTSGSILALDENAAFVELKRDGFSPISLRASGGRTARAGTPEPSARETAELLSSLAELLNAGADIRTALSILAAKFERASVEQVCEQLVSDISGGGALDQAFGRAFQRHKALIGPMVAAGEASGDLAGGLQRAAEVLTGRLKLRDQMVSVLAYPTFVFVTAIGAVFAILLFIVPSIAPLAQELGAEPPPMMAAMMAVSDFLRANLLLLAGASVAGLAAIAAAVKLGVLSVPLEALVIDGPARRTVRGLVFGGFALSLGTMISAGAPISDALRLAIRSVPSKGARRRLEPVTAGGSAGRISFVSARPGSRLSAIHRPACGRGRGVEHGRPAADAQWSTGGTRGAPTDRGAWPDRRAGAYRLPRGAAWRADGKPALWRQPDGAIGLGIVKHRSVSRFGQQSWGKS
jgi:type II secretory pathway component PulF